MRRWTLLPILIAVGAAGAALPSPAQAADVPAAAVQFNRDILPILSDNCFPCHGPDQAKRKADLRLDFPETAFADRGGYRVIVPGDSSKSMLFTRITSEDKKQRMPPARSGRMLTPAQIELVRRWIEQGAQWQKHWSLIPPQRPALPETH